MEKKIMWRFHGGSVWFNMETCGGKMKLSAEPGRREDKYA